MSSMEPTFWNTQVELIKAMGSPARPDHSDIACMRTMFRQRIAGWPASRRIKVLVLGVTPEIVGMDWPAGTVVTAVDRSEGMIEAFWLGDVPGQRRLVRADWMALPFEPDTFHFVFGDNVFNAMDYPQGYRDLADAVAKVTRPEGLLIVRVLCQAQPKEDCDEIVKRFRAGELTDYQPFRFRMMTASQASVEEGLYTSKEAIDRTMEEHGLCMAEVYEKTGHQPLRPPPSATSAPMSPYKVTYPIPDEFCAAIAHRFAVVDTRHGDHTLAHRTPVFALERKA
jgi:SAM-dependent methyltransferase